MSITKKQEESVSLEDKTTGNLQPLEREESERKLIPSSINDGKPHQ